MVQAPTVQLVEVAGGALTIGAEAKRRPGRLLDVSRSARGSFAVLALPRG
ncbi:hypothetical protein [Saccharopolyspora sp. NPDC002686]